MFSESVCKGQRQCDGSSRYSVPQNRNVVNTLLSGLGFVYRPTRAVLWLPIRRRSTVRGAVQRDCSAAEVLGFSLSRWSMIVIRCFSTAGFAATDLFTLPPSSAHSRDVCPAVITFPVFPTRVPDTPTSSSSVSLYSLSLVSSDNIISV